MLGQTGPAWFVLQGQHGSVRFWPSTVRFELQCKHSIRPPSPKRPRNAHYVGLEEPNLPMAEHDHDGTPLVIFLDPSLNKVHVGS